MISAGDPKVTVTGDRRAAHALGHESAKLWTKEQLAEAAEKKAAELARLEAEQALAALSAPDASRVDIAKAKAVLEGPSKGGVKAGRFASTAGAVAASKESPIESIAELLANGDVTHEKAAALKRLVVLAMNS